MAISIHGNQLLLVTVCSKIGLVPAVLLPQQQEWVQYLPSHHDLPVTSGSRIVTTQILPVLTSQIFGKNAIGKYSEQRITSERATKILYFNECSIGLSREDQL